LALSRNAHLLICILVFFDDVVSAAFEKLVGSKQSHKRPIFKPQRKQFDLGMLNPNKYPLLVVMVVFHYTNSKVGIHPTGRIDFRAFRHA